MLPVMSFRLIRTREYEQQRHRFQLIIITHDADFLNILNTANTGPLVDFYYKIYKDNEYEISRFFMIIFC